MNQTSDDINLKMNKDQGNDNEDEDDKEDHKPTAQEKKQAEETQDNSDSDDDGPMKKKRKKESFSLGKVLCQYIDLDDGEPSYIDTRKLQGEVQEAHQRLAELDALGREYQCTIDAYHDLYNRFSDEHGLHRMYKYAPMQLGELQANQKKKNQLLYAIGSMLRLESMEYPMTYPLSTEQDLFLNKWNLRWCFKYDLVTKMPDGEEKSMRQ